MLGIRHGYRTTKNCIPKRVTRLKNCVYIVVLTHVECVVRIQRKNIWESFILGTLRNISCLLWRGKNPK